MNYDVAADKFTLGAAQGAAGGVMGMALGGFNALAQGVADEQAMKDQYFQQLKLNNMSQMFNKDMFNYQMGKQYEFWQKTNYAAQVEQLRKAGLNPALLYGKGGGMGATTGSASAGNFQSHAGSDTDRMGLAVARQGQAIQMSLLASQIANINADTELKKADAEKTKGVDTENVKSQTDVNIANIKSIEANTRNTDLRSEGQLVTNELLKLQKLYEEGTLDDRILNQKLQNDQLGASIRKLNEEIPWIGKLAQGQLNVYEADVKVKTSQNRLNNANAADKEFYNDDYQRKLRTNKQELENKNIYQQNREMSLKGDALQLKNEFLKNYGFSPDSSMAGLVAGMIAKYSDEKGNLVEGWKTELVKELKQLVTDFSKMQNKINTGKFPWE